MIKATWKIKLYDADAQAVADEIAAIGETATPVQIVDKARDEATELHKCFTWDDAEAAEKYRLNEARQIVRLLVIKPREDEAETKSEPIRLFYKTDRDHDSGYKQTRLILQDKDEYRALLRQAKAELNAFRVKYKTLVELEAVFEAIDELL